MFEASHTPPELDPGQTGLRVDHHSWTAGFRDLYDHHQADAPDRAQWIGVADLDRPLMPDTEYRGDIDLHWSSQSVAEQAVRLITEARDPDRRLFMQVNLGPPHPPYAAPEPWYSRFDPELITPFPHDLPRHAPLAMRAQREHRTGHDADPSLLRRMQAVYYAMIARVDDQIGRILEALDDQGLTDDTAILFTSDHGDFAGQYGLPEKWDTTFADCLTHVPCIWSAPGLPQRQNLDTLTDHTDLAQTLLGLLGLDINWTTHGHDLRPLLAGQTDRLRDAVFADGGHEPEMRRRVSETQRETGKQRTYRLCPDAMARARMIRTQHHKLVIRETGDHELYDLAADRWELDNRYGDPIMAGVRAGLMERLLRWTLETDPDRPRQPTVTA